MISANAVYTEDGQATTEPHYPNDSTSGGESVAAPTREQRKAYRESLMGHENNNAIQFQTAIATALGIEAGVFARQLLFWEGRSWDEEGWTYKSIPEAQRETGLTRGQQDKARRELDRAGLLEHQVRQAPDRRNTRHYRFNLLALMDFLDGGSGKRQDPEISTLHTVQGPCENQQGPCEKAQDLQKGTQKVTQKIPSGGEPPKPEPSTTTPQDTREHPEGGNVIELQEKRPPKSSSEVAVSDLVRGIEDAGGRITRSSRGKYGKAFNRLVEGEGVTEEELEKVVARIVSRWPEREISADWALSDVLNGRDESEKAGKGSGASTGSATPEPALQALREHERYGQFARAAERHDFTSRQQPDWKILQSLGGTDQERQDNARKMGNVARRAMKEAESETSGEPEETGGFFEGFEWWCK